MVVNEKGQNIAEFLAEYDSSKFAKPSVTADGIVFSADYKSVLLIQRGNHPCIGQWAFAGGFCEAGESAEQTCARELEEETGLKDIALRQIAFVSTPNRDPRDWIMTAMYVGVVQAGTEVRGSDDACDAKFWNIKAKFAEDKINITLTNAESVLKVQLDVKRDSFGQIDINNTNAKYTDLAFDHGVVLAYAIENIAKNSSMSLQNWE